MTADLLVLDDLGAEKTSEWVEETMNLIVNTRYNERRLTIFTSNYEDIPDDTDPNSLLFRIGHRMRSRLHEMCEFVELDGADYRELPANGGVDDLVTLWKTARSKRRCRPRRPAGARPAARARVRDGRADLKWSGGQGGIVAWQSIRNWPECLCNLIAMLGLYLHIPFCSAICNYCNFNRGLFDAALKARYVEALVARDRRRRPADAAGARRQRRHDLSSAAGRRRCSSRPRSAASSTPAARRSTSPPTPRSRSRPTPRRVDAGAARRLSRGRRQPPEFRRPVVPRRGAAAAVAAARRRPRPRRRSREARAAGFDNVSLDLMMWLPGQQVDEWLESVDAAIALGPDHLSLYLLELYPNAPLQGRDGARRAGRRRPTTTRPTMYLTAMERLDAAGYEQYEISNVARPGRRSRHNLKYWTDGEWLGFGCGAHSTRDGVRWKNVVGHRGLHRSGAARRVAGGVDVRRAVAETSGSAMRCSPGCGLTDGVDLDAIRARYGVDVWERYGAELAAVRRSGPADRRQAAAAADPPGNASCSRGDDVFV